MICSTVPFLLLSIILPVTLSKNPFEGKPLYLNPYFQRQVWRHVRESKVTDMTRYKGLANVSTGFWIVSKNSIGTSKSRSAGTFLGVLRDAASKRPAPVVTAVVYNLPNRDCAAEASNGEICCKKMPNGECDFTATTCGAGLREYRASFVNQIAKYAKTFCKKVPLVFIVEPDSIPNLATNLGNPKCGSKSTRTAYKNGVKYAVWTLASACPEASLYLDAAHGAWLGWSRHAETFIKTVRQLGLARHLKGFAVNVANYQDVGIRCPFVNYCIGGKNAKHPCCKRDPCGLIGQWNSGHSALAYVDLLAFTVARVLPQLKPTFVIDTAKNGVPNSRKDCSNWCNVRGAGLGIRPTTNTAHKLVDAYLWIKPPTESDGCTKFLPNGKLCPRFDSRCASVDSVGFFRYEPRSPEAGRYFKYKFERLVRNRFR